MIETFFSLFGRYKLNLKVEFDTRNKIAVFPLHIQYLLKFSYFSLLFNLIYIQSIRKFILIFLTVALMEVSLRSQLIPTPSVDSKFIDHNRY